MIDPRCIWSSIVNAILGWVRTGIRIGGHDYYFEARWTNCNVSVLRCNWCGRYQILWERTDESRYWPHDDEQLSPAELADRQAEQDDDQDDRGVIIKVRR